MVNRGSCRMAVTDQSEPRPATKSLDAREQRTGRPEKGRPVRHGRRHKDPRSLDASGACRTEKCALMDNAIDRSARAPALSPSAARMTPRW